MGVARGDIKRKKPQNDCTNRSRYEYLVVICRKIVISRFFCCWNQRLAFYYFNGFQFDFAKTKYFLEYNINDEKRKNRTFYFLLV